MYKLKKSKKFQKLATKKIYPNIEFDYAFCFHYEKKFTKLMSFGIN